MPQPSLVDTVLVHCSACGGRKFSLEAQGRDYIYHGSNQQFQHVRCSDCGHIYLNPQPTISSLPIMYPPHYGTFSRKFRGHGMLGRIKNFVNMRRISAILAKLPPNARVLDVGCGNGELLLAIKGKRPDLDPVGLDWHVPEETRQVLEANGIDVIESPMETVEFPDERFDLVLMLQLIEHLWEPEECVRRLAGALANGGRLLVETPNTDGWDRKLFSGGTWGGYYFPRHLNLYNFERLAELLARAGLTLETQRNLPAPLIGAYSLQATTQELVGWKTRWAKLFGTGNLPFLAAWTTLDIIFTAAGRATSNQQAVAIKEI